MSSKKQRADAVSARLDGQPPDKKAVKQAERFVTEVERLLTRHSKRIKSKDDEKVRTAVKEVRAAIEGQQQKRLSAAMTDLQTQVDQVLGFAKKSTTREYAESIGIAVLIAVLLRFFVLEAFKIPTGSMIPTLEIGDHIFVNKFIYGLRVPFSNESWFAQWGTPQRGHVIVFRYPVDKAKDYIKRVVAVAGDRVWVDGTDVYVNGKKLEHNARSTYERSGDRGYAPFVGFKEQSFGEESSEYAVQYQRPTDPMYHFPRFTGQRLNGLDCKKPDDGPRHCVIKEGYVFVMGDNRDNSQDSREWGGVPHRLVKGRAMFIWFSWGPEGIDWSRFGKAVR